MANSKGNNAKSVKHSKDSSEQVQDQSTSSTSTYEGADQDGFINMRRLDESYIESSYRLYHGNTSSVQLMEAMGGKDVIGKKYSGLVFVNDMSQAPKAVSIKDSIKLRGIKDMEGNEANFNATALKKIQAYIDDTFKKYKDAKSAPTNAELERIRRFGNTVGYVNLFMYQVVAGTTILVRVPGSKGLRDGIPKDVRTLARQGGLRSADSTLFGEEVVLTFNWYDKAKNTHIASSKDWSGLVSS